MVLLEQRLPDGTSAMGWMIDLPVPRARDQQGELDQNAKVLLAFRVTERIDKPAARVFDATRLPEQRRGYLHLEGDLGPERGTLTRLAHGQVDRVWLHADGAVDILGSFLMRKPTMWSGIPMPSRGPRLLSFTAAPPRVTRPGVTDFDGPPPGMIARL
jgi:hypothetical protein